VPGRGRDLPFLVDFYGAAAMSGASNIINRITTMGSSAQPERW